MMAWVTISSSANARGSTGRPDGVTREAYIRCGTGEAAVPEAGEVPSASVRVDAGTIIDFIHGDGYARRPHDVCFVIEQTDLGELAASNRWSHRNR